MNGLALHVLSQILMEMHTIRVLGFKYHLRKCLYCNSLVGVQSPFIAVHSKGQSAAELSVRSVPLIPLTLFHTVRYVALLLQRTVVCEVSSLSLILQPTYLTEFDSKH
jgi:hypothetical protein